MRAVILLGCLLLLAAPASQPAWAQTAATTNSTLHGAEVDEMRTRLGPRLLTLDVRSASEVLELGTLPGALNIPVDELEARLDELPRDRPIFTACQGGVRAARAAEILRRHGFEVSASCALGDYTGERVFPAQP